MKTNKLIFIVAISFSLLVNFPRIIFLFTSENNVLTSYLGLSIQDTLFRFFFLFLLGFAILQVNVNLVPRWFHKNLFLKSVLLSFLIFIIWNGLFKISDLWLNNGTATSIAPRINTFIHFFETMMLIVISRTIVLNEQSKNDAIEKERLIQQSFQNELAALKNQINPHFLFNSLNSLSLLVREDQEAAGKFISKLSFLYRHILQSKDQDLTILKEELMFLESYLYLMKQRYGDNFKVDITINNDLYQHKIPSLALQFLVENAIKHNEISANRPLTISIYNNEDSIIVRNKLQRRKKGIVESTSLGLSNLNSRFKLLLNRDITIVNDGDYFMVKLPIL